MFDFVEGSLSALTPVSASILVGGVAFQVHISLHTYTSVHQQTTPGQEKVRLYVHMLVREDAILLFGFFSTRERDIFRQLISVSGVGAGTARMILSSLSPDEVIQAVSSANVGALKNVKGIGLKTAQRIVVDLKDKIGGLPASEEMFLSSGNTSREEALSALVNLGFPKSAVEKVLEKICAATPGISVEDMVKQALRGL